MKLNFVVGFDELEQSAAMYKHVLVETGSRDKSDVYILAKPETCATIFRLCTEAVVVGHFGVENAQDPLGNFDVDDKQTVDFIFKKIKTLAMEKIRKMIKNFYKSKGQRFFFFFAGNYDLEKGQQKKIKYGRKNCCPLKNRWRGDEEEKQKKKKHIQKPKSKTRKKQFTYNVVVCFWFLVFGVWMCIFFILIDEKKSKFLPRVGAVPEPSHTAVTSLARPGTCCSKWRGQIVARVTPSFSPTPASRTFHRIL